MTLADWLKQEAARGATHVAVIRTDSGELSGEPIALTANTLSTERLVRGSVKKTNYEVFVPLAIKSTSGRALPLDRQGV